MNYGVFILWIGILSLVGGCIGAVNHDIEYGGRVGMGPLIWTLLGLGFICLPLGIAVLS